MKQKNNIENLLDHKKTEDDSLYMNCKLSDFKFQNGKLITFNSDVHVTTDPNFPKEHEKQVLTTFLPILIEKLKENKLVENDLIASIDKEIVQLNENGEAILNDKDFTKKSNNLFLNMLSHFLTVEEFEELGQYLEQKPDNERENMIYDIFEFIFTR